MDILKKRSDGDVQLNEIASLFMFNNNEENSRKFQQNKQCFFRHIKKTPVKKMKIRLKNINAT